MSPCETVSATPAADDRQHPQERAAVGEQQDDDDDAEGGEQQGAVDAFEDLGRVGRLSARAADVDVDAVDGRDVPQLVGDVGHLHPPVGAEVERDQRLHHLAVLGRLRAEHLAFDAPEVGELRDVLLALRPCPPRTGRRRARRRRRWGSRRGPGRGRASRTPGWTRRLPGSQDDASLFWTSVSLDAKAPATPTARSQRTSTTHLVTRPVSLPAICRCIIRFQHRDPVGTPDFGPEPLSVAAQAVGPVLCDRPHP